MLSILALYLLCFMLIPRHQVAPPSVTRWNLAAGTLRTNRVSQSLVLLSGNCETAAEAVCVPYTIQGFHSGVPGDCTGVVRHKPKRLTINSERVGLKQTNKQKQQQQWQRQQQPEGDCALVLWGRRDTSPRQNHTATKRAETPTPQAARDEWQRQRVRAPQRQTSRREERERKKKALVQLYFSFPPETRSGRNHSRDERATEGLNVIRRQQRG